MKIIDGKKIANNILAGLKKEIELKKIKSCLAIILVGDDPSSLLYIKAKEKAAARIGVKIEKFLLPKKSSESQILKVIRELNNNLNISGILVQLPLPKGINPDRIINRISPKKDIDGLLPDSGFNSPFILSIWEALQETKENLKNKKIVALVNLEIFGKRLNLFFKRRGLRVSYVILKEPFRATEESRRKPRDSSLTLRMTNRFKEANILITALGRPGVIKGSMLKKGVILIDGGISRINGKIAGDIDAESVEQKAKWLSPVPEGLGPLTVAFLLKNLIKTYLGT